MINTGTHVTIKDINGVTQTVTVLELAKTVAPVLLLIETEWTGKSRIDYIKYLAGLQGSQY